MENNLSTKGEQIIFNMETPRKYIDIIEKFFFDNIVDFEVADENNIKILGRCTEKIKGITLALISGSIQLDIPNVGNEYIYKGCLITFNPNEILIQYTGGGYIKFTNSDYNESKKKKESIFPVRGRVITSKELEHRDEVHESLKRIIGNDKVVVLCDSEELKSPLERLMEQAIKMLVEENPDMYGKLLAKEQINSVPFIPTPDNSYEFKQKLENFFGDFRCNLDYVGLLLTESNEIITNSVKQKFDWYGKKDIKFENASSIYIGDGTKYEHIKMQFDIDYVLIPLDKNRLFIFTDNVLYILDEVGGNEAHRYTLIK